MGAREALAPYHRKRDFAKTPEPHSGGKKGKGALAFVIQKHHASRLHYDFRLELDGTLKSWAVPKGPCLDPHVKRMAVLVEDHPISYGDFEGTIPPGQYGAGTVIVWDRGDWVPDGDARKALAAGKLKFELRGEKLSGHWTLVRMRGHDEKQEPWLLIKENDAEARALDAYDVTEARPDSVISGASVNAPPKAAKVGTKKLAAKKVADKKVGAAKAVANKVATPTADATTVVAKHVGVKRKSASRNVPLPETFAPQLATLATAPPAEPDDWTWELKFDGYRLLARVEKGKVRCFTRNGHDWTDKLPELARALAQLDVRSAWLDGEIVVLGENGAPDFQGLQNAFEKHATAAIVYWVFDLPFVDGEDLREQPVETRRERLGALLTDDLAPRLRFSESFDALPRDLLASVTALGFEGLIGKHKGSTYASRRSAEWIKLKSQQRQEFVIGGYTEPKGSRAGFGALLLGVHDEKGALRYCGNVGTGFDCGRLADIKQKLDVLATDRSPFAEGDAGVPRSVKATWVKPRLVAEVAFGEWTRDHRIRHSVFQGLRSDKPARQVTREVTSTIAGAPAKAAVATKETAMKKQSARKTDGLRITNAERVIDSESGVTKGELVAYYLDASKLLLPHLKGRPVSLVRAPEGIGGELFFQKHAKGSDMPGITLLDPSLDRDHDPLLQIDRIEGLASAAQMNVVELHTWNATSSAIDRPDRMTFDLDPGDGVDWAHMQEAALLMRTLLDELGLGSFLKTSGGKGLHVLVPIRRHYGWDDVKSFSQAVVQHMAQTIPDRFVAKSGPRNRVGKIFVDYLRNGFGATTVSAWSVRARPGLGVSVPVAWDELPTLRSGAHWTIRDAPERFGIGNASWAGWERARKGLASAMKVIGFVPAAG
ncbi:DNA ligase D [Variovorax guangxiensis]|uniref:DNA ligase (ATP) n=1 Tax=Variovorax guangxiensis TaxID=1775474 RepID=A0A502DQC7_9BURK|nr:DNA ligase D [Variovorax guangxiensis]TPG23087.1 DNA ligase D [Variovorax ginsengisoli]TPG27635.1 DNA ligase D [Variovorax guangxiensis]